MRKLLPPLLAAAVLAAAAPQVAHAYNFHAPRVIGTSLDVTAVAPDAATADQAYTLIHNEISRLERMLSTRIPSSYISQINQTNAPVVVPPEVIELLSAYHAAASLTSGLISPLTGELTARWSQAAQDDTLPTAAELQRLTARIQHSSLILDRANSTVQRIGPALINIDALGKPFILAQAADAAWNALPHLTGLLVNIGGDITTRGTPSFGVQPLGWSKSFGVQPLGCSEKPNLWHIDIAHPSHPADNAPPIATVALTHASIVTSGDAARGRTIAGIFISHLLNPLTGLPASRNLSATVMHQNPIVANALSTAFCLAPDTLAPGSAGGPNHSAQPNSASLQKTALENNAAYFIAAPNTTPIASPNLPAIGPVSLAPGSAGGSNNATQPHTVPANWPKGFEATIAFNILPSASPKDHRAVALAWIEDEKGNHVKTLAVWGNIKDKDNRRAMARWIKLAINNAQTTASRIAGNYSVTWDGTDQDNKPVPQGKYIVHMEVTYEHAGPTTVVKTEIDCEGDKASTKITKKGLVDASDIAYGPAPKKP